MLLVNSGKVLRIASPYMLVMFQDHINGPSFLGPSVRLPSKDCSCRKGISTRYPVQFKRKTVKDFFGRPPFHTNLVNDAIPAYCITISFVYLLTFLIITISTSDWTFA